jgi:hypothetical protein
VYAELVPDDWTTPGIEYRMDVRDSLPAGGTVRFLINGGNLACGTADAGGVFAYPQSQPYDPVAHRWLRIGATSATAVEWSASPDGTTWTTLHTMDPAPVDPTSVVLLFVAGEWVGTTSGGLWVDNVNTLGLPPPSTLLNDAAAIYVGSIAAVAVYAGAVKVWPPAGPPPAFAGWDFAAGADSFEVEEGSVSAATWTAADGGYVSAPVTAAALGAAATLGLDGGPMGRPENPRGLTGTRLEAHGLVPGRTYTMRITYRVTGPAATGVGARSVRVAIDGESQPGTPFTGGWVALDAGLTVQEWPKGTDPDGQWHTFDLAPVVYQPPPDTQTDARAWLPWRPAVTLHVNSGGGDVRTLDLGQVEFIEVTA